MAEATIREDILQKFPDFFGTKNVNGREVNIERTITTLTQELGPEIAAALTARRMLLESPAPVREKYAWPKWDETFEDPVTGHTLVCVTAFIRASPRVVAAGKFVVS